MYAIYAYIDPPNHPNVGIYGIHGASGYCLDSFGVKGSNVRFFFVYCGLGVAATLLLDNSSEQCSKTTLY